MRVVTSSRATRTRTSSWIRAPCSPSSNSSFRDSILATPPHGGPGRAGPLGPLPPARVLRRPAEPLAGARVRGAALLGHAVDRHPVAAREALVDRDAGWLGGA